MSGYERSISNFEILLDMDLKILTSVVIKYGTAKVVGIDWNRSENPYFSDDSYCFKPG